MAPHLHGDVYSACPQNNWEVLPLPEAISKLISHCWATSQSLMDSIEYCSLCLKVQGGMANIIITVSESNFLSCMKGCATHFTVIYRGNTAANCLRMVEWILQKVSYSKSKKFKFVLRGWAPQKLGCLQRGSLHDSSEGIRMHDLTIENLFIAQVCKGPEQTSSANQFPSGNYAI